VLPGERVLEIGTGLGYQAALLAELGARVWSVEIVEEFASEAGMRLLALGYANVSVRVGDGSRGWADHQALRPHPRHGGRKGGARSPARQLAPAGALSVRSAARTSSS
jgi:protein-L-isoaspartate(D-aspartate) O-methyltransferase